MVSRTILPLLISKNKQLDRWNGRKGAPETRFTPPAACQCAQRPFTTMNQKHQAKLKAREARQARQARRVINGIFIGLIVLMILFLLCYYFFFG